jgi:hypothetical protein
VSNGPSPFWQEHRGIIWSNPGAGDSAHIRAALLRPRFGLLLEIVVAFGLERLREEWNWLQAEPTRETERAWPVVERILHHIEEGFSRASTAH